MAYLLRPATPPCVICHTCDHVVVCETPEFPNIHSYHCTRCGKYWATDLTGRLLIHAYDDSVSDKRRPTFPKHLRR